MPLCLAITSIVIIIKDLPSGWCVPACLWNPEELDTPEVGVAGSQKWPKELLRRN